MKIPSPAKLQTLRKMVSAAETARQSGMYVQAESLFRDVLKQAPEAWDVRQQYATLLAGTQRLSEAARQFRMIVAANPLHAPSHANLANALAESGELDEAIKEFQRASRLDAALSLQLAIPLGETLRRANRHVEAIAVLKEALDRDHANHAAFCVMGMVYRDMNDMPRALECFEHACQLAPSNPEYRMNFAATLRSAGLDNWAAEQFYEAVSLKPDGLEAIVLLAEVLEKQRRFDEAKECLDRALQLRPALPELLERRGHVYLGMGDAEHALQDFETVSAKVPGRYMSLLGMGLGHIDAGSHDAAIPVLEKLIELYPQTPDGYIALARTRKFMRDDPLIPHLEEMATREGFESTAMAGLQFSLGKIYDDCKIWDKAFVHYAHGNRLRNQNVEYKPELQEAQFDKLISVFTSEFMEQHRHLGMESCLPVFIVGMPRSGTTLTEQIVSSHPHVIGAGEVEFWGKAAKAVPYSMGTDKPYPDCLTTMSDAQAHVIASKYLTLLKKIAGEETGPERITDKMPHNFVQLGLIALLFPNAPIIHCRRDAMDNCLSIYFQNFGGDHPYAYDLQNLGHHYRQYERLMAHWHTVMPGRILDINYEDTIADPEYWSRKLIEHVGLEWNEACLAPHKLQRTVKTASHWQVRQPIYKTSVQRWKHYEQYLGPLQEALGYQERQN